MCIYQIIFTLVNIHIQSNIKWHYNLTHYIITTRPYGYQKNDFRVNEHFETIGFTDENVKEYIEKGSADSEGLEDISIVLEDAFLECGVEAFSPEEGSNYKTAEGVADNPKDINTDDESKNFTIAKVLSEGYKREIGDGSYKIITEAKVSIYIYKKPKEESNNKIQE